MQQKEIDTAEAAEKRIKDAMSQVSGVEEKQKKLSEQKLELKKQKKPVSQELFQDERKLNGDFKTAFTALSDAIDAVVFNKEKDGKTADGKTDKKLAKAITANKKALKAAIFPPDFKEATEMFDKAEANVLEVDAELALEALRQAAPKKPADGADAAALDAYAKVLLAKPYENVHKAAKEKLAALKKSKEHDKTRFTKLQEKVSAAALLFVPSFACLPAPAA